MTAERNYGVDLAKTVAIFLVVVVHVMTCGGGFPKSGAGVFALAPLMAVGLCCVNLFALVSGYLGVDSRPSPKKFFKLWLQVFATGILMASVAHFAFGVPLSFHGIRRTLMPVTSGEYWYFTAYAVLYCFMPVLNRGLAELERNQAAGLCAALFLVLCVSSPVDRHDVFRLDRGYSAMWLVVLYVFGAVLRLHVRKLPRKRLCAGLLVVSVLVTAAMAVFGSVHPAFAPTYLSPSVVLSAVAILLLCLRCSGRIRPRLPGLMVFLSSTAFGVYLVHVQPMFFYGVFRGRFGFVTALPAAMMPLAVLGCSAAVHALCLVPSWLIVRLTRGTRRT